MLILAYILAHGLTAMLITPLQARIIPDITAFASLVYLPHGVRVLATWLLGRVAFVPLCIGAFLSEVIFTPAETSSAMDAVILVSIAVGAASAIAAFEMFRLFGKNLYAGQTFQVHWKWLLLVGILASVINSVGQSIVFSGTFLPGFSFAVLSTYAIGDLVGLIITTLALMLVFRGMRGTSNRR
ncbi:hypothetical protein P1J78_00020 [Psychromarinibacter sp. C21-152]|uniref:Uncharacterized protein n=1 Tax=Psychromarinibacter sediminicola TaxID=3033385 RepID=A0AAE3NRC5_9RHOB|nr:hypothetical protein [Psychromarinibacter sediminicola]MDF0599102.1 hypothetical protein [Psychromarinibacter sediminicola]